MAEDFGTYPHVIFNVPGGRIDIPNQGAGIRYAPGWDGWHNDMAVFPLTDPEEPSPARQLVAPLGAQRYQIFRGSGEVGRQFTFVGYGGTGTGATGWQYSEEPAPRRVGSNRFDDDWTLFHQGGPVNLPQRIVRGRPRR